MDNHMVYFQLSQIYSLAAQRLDEFSNAFFQNVLQRRIAALPSQPITILVQTPEPAKK
jgi:hypothetical protein